MTPSTTRILSTVVCATLSTLLTGGLLRAAEPTQRFGGERTDVVAVEVPVQVTRDGQAVRGLTAADFEVYEGRKKQVITGFEMVDLAATTATATGTGNEAAAATVPPAARRHFLLLFDLSNSEPKAIAKARSAAKDVVKDLHPSDLAAVATHSATKGTKLVIGFTTDRRQLAIAIETLGGSDLIDRSPDPLNLSISSAGRSSSSGVSAPAGRGDEEFAANLEEDSTRARANDRQFQTQALTAYTRALGDLGKMMGNVAGRKYVVLLSEGFDSSLLVGKVTTQEEQTQIAGAVERGEFYNVNNDERFGSSQSGNDLERMLEEFRRADCVIQAVDIGGLREEGAKRANGQDGLFAMAQQTGGELYRNFNNLGEAMGKMLERTRVTYVLTFQPDVKRDGTYHKIKVELKNDPRGAKVSYRTGYFAPKPFDQRDPSARLLDAADTILGGREGGLLKASVLAAPFPGVGDHAYVPVLIEIGGAEMLAGIDSGALPAEIYAYAIAADGSIGDYFGQTLGFDLAKVKGQLQQSGLKYFGHLELTPGTWSIRVLVRNGRTGASSLRVVPVVVPTFSGGPPAVLTPFFPEPQGKWLIVREQPRGEQKTAPYPFMTQQQAYIPASLPVLPAGQEAAMSLVAFNLPSGDVRAQAQVLGADGHEMPGGELRLIGREAAAGGQAVLRASFNPTSLKPGEYRLKVRLAAGDGTNPVEAATVPFEVR
ncbi:MAG TPA: VWA domain-containing protein [Thermoanaerobaculia bacterium]|jgi:VWFA-related protein|nr:VWA domain-containing protein [Thermoanaerobaculia bacterium]